MPQGSRDFSVCGTTEAVSRTFNFAAGLAVGETLLSATCAVSVESGTDATPLSRLIAGPSISGGNVIVILGGMLDGVVYQVLVTVQTSAGQTLVCWALQPCSGE